MVSGSRLDRRLPRLFVTTRKILPPPAFSSAKAQPTDTVNMDTLRENGADKVLLSMLESAFGDGDELKIA